MSEIEITLDHAASSYGVPVCLIDGNLVDDTVGLRACCDRLGWTRGKLSRETGKSMGSIDNYRTGRISVPAEVWNILDQELKMMEGEEND